MMDQQKNFRNIAKMYDDIGDEEEAMIPDPHSQQEILKVYMKQKRVNAPESFERIKEDHYILSDDVIAQDSLSGPNEG